MELDTARLMQQGMQAVQDGDKPAAWSYFQQILWIEPNHEEAWLWAAGVAPSTEEMIDCLQHVLENNPANERAQSGLAWARQQLGQEQGAGSSLLARIGGQAVQQPQESQSESTPDKLAGEIRSTLPPLRKAESTTAPEIPTGQPNLLGSVFQSPAVDVPAVEQNPSVKLCRRCGYYNPVETGTCLNCNSVI